MLPPMQLTASVSILKFINVLLAQFVSLFRSFVCWLFVVVFIIDVTKVAFWSCKFASFFPALEQSVTASLLPRMLDNPSVKVTNEFSHKDRVFWDAIAQSEAFFISIAAIFVPFYSILDHFLMKPNFVNLHCNCSLVCRMWNKFRAWQRSHQLHLQ
jgi:hypothetical protein